MMLKLVFRSDFTIGFVDDVEEKEPYDDIEEENTDVNFAEDNEAVDLSQIEMLKDWD